MSTVVPRSKKTGNRQSVRPHADDRTLESRLGNNITITDSGCWVYGNPAGRNYRQVAGMGTSVHRYVYQILVGDIPDGWHLHHLCQVKACCNPDHLRPMSPDDHAAHHAEQRRANRLARLAEQAVSFT